MIIYVILEKGFNFNDNFYLTSEDFIKANKSFVEEKDAVNYINILNKEFIKETQGELRDFFHYEIDDFSELEKSDSDDVKTFFELFGTNDIREIDNNDFPDFSEAQLDFLVKILKPDIYEIQEVELCSIFS